MTLFFFFLINLFIYFGLCWVFVAAHRPLQLQQVEATPRRSMQASHCGGLPHCRAWALGTWVSAAVAHRLSSCGSQAPERRLSSCGARAQLLHSMWDPPGPGLEPTFPALASRLPTTVPPGKPMTLLKYFLLVPRFWPNIKL